MESDDIKHLVESGQLSVGIELGSTRIKQLLSHLIVKQLQQVLLNGRTNMKMAIGLIPLMMYG